VLQQGQVLKLTSRGAQGTPLWAYRYRLGGRDARRVQRGGFASEHDAQAALERALEQLRREGGIGRTVTLAEFVDQYLEQHEASPVTLKKLRFLLTRAVAAFGAYRLDELNPVEIAAWRMTVPPGYRFEATQALRQVLARAIVWRMLDVNPAKQGVENPQRRLTEKRPFESWDEIEAVADRLELRLAAMVLFAAATGMRPGEWVALEHRDIDRDARVAYVHRSFSKGRLTSPKTEASKRAVPLQARALGARPATARWSCRPALLGHAWRLPRPAQLPQPQLEARPARGRHRAVPPHLRSQAHVRDFRPPCRHLHLRALALHGRQPDHDRPPLRPPRARRTRARDPPARQPQRALGGRWWTLGGRREAITPPRKTTKTAAEQAISESPLTDSNRRPPPYHGGALPTELRGRAADCSRGL
jgi:integrase